jgi:hypothetical protein
VIDLLGKIVEIELHWRIKKNGKGGTGAKDAGTDSRATVDFSDLPDEVQPKSGADNA